MSEQKETKKTIKILRYRPDINKEPYYETFEVPQKDDTVVLNQLNYIKDTKDGSLSFRWSCQMGVCGSCGAMVNGKPVLTCATFSKDCGNEITVEPLENFPIVKDLVVEMDGFMKKIESVKPWIIRDQEKDIEEGEYIQSPEQLDDYKQFSMCINCQLCYSACPVVGEDEEFLGPAASALAYRYISDTRDQGTIERMNGTLSHVGVWECSYVGECSTVCPKSVDPALAIQRMKALGATEITKTLMIPDQKKTVNLPILGKMIKGWTNFLLSNRMIALLSLPILFILALIEGGNIEEKMSKGKEKNE